MKCVCLMGRVYKDTQISSEFPSREITCTFTPFPFPFPPLSFLDEIQDQMAGVEEEAEVVKDLFELIHKYQVPTPPEDLAVYQVCVYLTWGLSDITLYISALMHAKSHFPTPTHAHVLYTSLTQLLTHSLTHSFTHSLIHTFTHSLTHSLTQLLTQLLTHSPTHSLTHSHSHSHSHPHVYTHKHTHRAFVRR